MEHLLFSKDTVRVPMLCEKIISMDLQVVVFTIFPTERNFAQGQEWGTEINCDLKKMVLKNGGSEINDDFLRENMVFKNGGSEINGELLRQKMVLNNA
ncbi:hypothetical protein Leryth_014750 [Lithospermum erythrorhizon]|nr:hypothetical protein Leryth_014750 [Lithospermum erythrorhizon]